jgi:hypothetical protein
MALFLPFLQSDIYWLRAKPQHILCTGKRRRYHEIHTIGEKREATITLWICYFFFSLRLHTANILWHPSTFRAVNIPSARRPTSRQTHPYRVATGLQTIDSSPVQVGQSQPTLINYFIVSIIVTIQKLSCSFQNT